MKRFRAKRFSKLVRGIICVYYNTPIQILRGQNIDLMFWQYVVDSVSFKVDTRERLRRYAKLNVLAEKDLDL